MEQEYLEVDGITNAIDYLEMIHHFLTKVDSEWKWKWVILATYQALYSFGLCALVGTSELNVTDGGKAGKTSKNPNKPHVFAIGRVIERLQKKEYLRRSNSKPLSIKPNEQQAIDALTTKFRHEFEHYKPNKKWIIAPQLVASMINDCLPVIEFIALESNCIVYDKDQLARVKLAFEQVRVTLTTIFEKRRDVTNGST